MNHANFFHAKRQVRAKYFQSHLNWWNIFWQVFFSLAYVWLVQGLPAGPYQNPLGSPQQEYQYQYQYQPRYYYYSPNSDGLSRPVVYPQLGMSPEYHNLVYNYVASMAGNENPPQVSQSVREYSNVECKADVFAIESPEIPFRRFLSTKFNQIEITFLRK